MIMLQTFEFNYHIDLLDLLSDKSICTDVYQLTREINTKTHWRKYNHGVKHIGTSRNKRLLIEVLNISKISTRDIIDNLKKNKCFNIEDRMIVLVAKERELKYKPRFFCNLLLHARIWQVLTETNAAEKNLHYIHFKQ